MIILSRRHIGEKEWEYLEFQLFSEAKQASFGFKRVSIRCDSCQAAVINGVFCHETGCPNTPGTCKECGCETRHGITCCDSCLFTDYLWPEHDDDFSDE